MHLKTPKFWFNNNHKISPLLYTLKPLSKLWELVLRFRLKNGLWEKMPIPVFCVGTPEFALQRSKTFYLQSKFRDFYPLVG